MLELVFTSAKNGLIPGRSGFCSVAWTEGMPKNLIGTLENLSTYNILYPPNDPRSVNNPVSYSYQKIRLGNRGMYVISRIAFAGLDYTGRTNKIAHHIVIENEAELANLQYGPISACFCEDNFFTSWEGEPRLLPRRHKLRSADISGFMARYWQNIMNAPEWAGLIADKFMANADNSGKCLYCEYDNETHGSSMLMLIAEIVRLMNRKYYNLFTFNTYFSAAANDIGCFFRATMSNCQNLASVKRFKPQDLISLTDVTPLPDNIPPTPAVLAARSDINPEYDDTDLKLATASDIVLEEIPVANETQEEISLKQHIRNNAAPQKDFIEFEPQKKELSSRARLIIFISCTFLLIVILIAASLIMLKMLPEKNAPAENQQQQPISKQDNNLLPAAVETNSPAVKTEIPEKTEKKKTQETTKVEPPEKPAVKTPPAQQKTKLNNKKTAVQKKNPVKKTAAETKKKAKKNSPVQYDRNSIRTLNPADSLKIFLGIINTKTNSFTLPQTLWNTLQIDLTISGQWDDNVSIRPAKFIGRINPISLKVYPINPALTPLSPDKSNPQAAMSVAIFDKSLSVTEPSAKYAPRKKYIKTITFHTSKGKYVWHNKWDSQYINVIPRGSVENFVYKKSEAELQLKDYITIENDDFRKLKLAVDRWNKYISEYNTANQNKKSSANFVKSDINAVKNGYENLRKSLSKHPSNINFEAVRKSFDKFYRDMTGLSPADINTKFTAYLQTRYKKVQDEITEIRTSVSMRSTESASNLRGDIRSQINKEKNAEKPNQNLIRQLRAQVSKLTYIIELEDYRDSLQHRLSSRTKTADTINDIADFFNKKLYAWANSKLDKKQLSETDRKNINKWKISDKIGSKFIADHGKQQKINRQFAAEMKMSISEENKLNREREELVRNLEKYSISKKWIAVPDLDRAFTSDEIRGICKELKSKVRRLAKGTR